MSLTRKSSKILPSNKLAFQTHVPLLLLVAFYISSSFWLRIHFGVFCIHKCQIWFYFTIRIFLFLPMYTSVMSSKPFFFPLFISVQILCCMFHIPTTLVATHAENRQQFLWECTSQCRIYFNVIQVHMPMRQGREGILKGDLFCWLGELLMVSHFIKLSAGVWEKLIIPEVMGE